MMREIYVRPAGLMAPLNAGPTTEVRGGFRLADGWLDFTALDIFERNGASVDRKLAGLGEFFEKDWGRRTINASDMFENLMRPRARLAGLSLDRPRIMGIVNVTPDSFSDGGRLATAAAAIDHALRLAAEGADILDIGGESTRPGAEPVTIAEEIRRVVPVIEGLRARTEVRSTPAMPRSWSKYAAGADIINDVSALMHDAPGRQYHDDPDARPGDPRTMQVALATIVLLDVFDFPKPGRGLPPRRHRDRPAGDRSASASATPEHTSS
jgi:dihydropteroate synthase